MARTDRQAAAAEPRTDTAGWDARARSEGVTRTELLVALDGANPRRVHAPVSLAGVHRVVIGRGDAPSVERHQVGARWELAVRLEDTQVSREHVVLERAGRGFTMTDPGSRNGTLVDGRRRGASAVAVADGTSLQVGRTLLVLRDVPVTAPTGEANPLPGFVTASTALRARLAELARIVQAGAGPILVRGPSGSGKEVVARGVHTLIQRGGRGGRFIGVNCAALPAALVEAELFGSRKGAYTGSVEDREGLLRAAHGGTLFLDEIGDLAPTSQAALLRVLEEREVRAIGATAATPVDLFVIAATHRDLESMMKSSEFRADLYARLDGFEVVLPPLEDRLEDLSPLVASVFERRGVTATFSAPAVAAIAAYAWPLNVRELEKALAQAAALAEDGVIDVAQLPAAAQAAQVPEGERDAADDEAEAAADPELLAQLRAELARHRGNVSAAARAMGKHRRQLHRWIARFEIDLDGYRG